MSEYTSRSEKNSPKKSSNALSWILCIAIAVGIALGVRAFIAEPVKVDGDSMNPTLYSHQSILVEKVSRYFGLPERGDIIIVHYPGSSANYVKRCIGLPGDTVEIQNSTVYINGAPLSEDYTSDAPYADMSAVTVPEGNVFVMGDNRANSMDSRMVGTLTQDMIVGHAVCVIWPLNQFHTIS